MLLHARVASRLNIDQCLRCLAGEYVQYSRGLQNDRDQLERESPMRLTSHMTAIAMLPRCMSWVWNIHRNTFRCSSYRFSPYVSTLNLAYTVFPTALGLPRHGSTISGDDLTQHETQSTIPAAEKLVGHSGRHYQVERVLQSKEAPPSHVYLTTLVPNKLFHPHGQTC